MVTMRIGRFVTPSGETLTGQFVDDRSARPLVGDLFGPHSFSNTTMPVASLLPPVLPPNIFAIGRNYAEHAKETGSKVPEAPLVFVKATTSLLAPGGTIRIPNAAPSEIDYEAEL